MTKEQTATQTRTEFAYLDELIGLEGDLPEVVRVPVAFAEQVGYGLIRPHVFINNPALAVRNATNSTIADIKKASLIDYLLGGSQGPCYCGSGRRHEKCHAEADLQLLRYVLLRLNKGE